MRVSMLFAAAMTATTGAVFACGSSSSGPSTGGDAGGSGGSGGATIPRCQGTQPNAGAASAACNACLTSQCGSQISTFDGDCTAYVACYEACPCTDTTCLTNCQSSITSRCLTDDQSVAACLTSNCASECGASATDGG